MSSYPAQVALEYFEQLEQSKPKQSLTDWIFGDLQMSNLPNPILNPSIVVHDGLDLPDHEKGTEMHWNGEHYVNDDIGLAFHPDQIFAWSSRDVVTDG